MGRQDDSFLGDLLFRGDASGLGGEAEAERGLFFGLLLGLRTSLRAFLDVRTARSWSSWLAVSVRKGEEEAERGL